MAVALKKQTASDTSNILILRLPERKTLRTVSIKIGKILRIAFSNDSSKLAIVGVNGFAVWKTMEDEPPTVAFRKGLRDIAFCPNGGDVVTVDASAIILWDIGLKSSQKFPRSAGFRTIAFNPNGSTSELATGGDAGNVTLWNLSTRHGNRLPGTFGSAAVEAVTFAQNPWQRKLGVANADGTAWIYDFDSLPQSFMYDDSPVTDIVLSGDGTKAVTSTYFGAIKVWHFDKGRTAETLEEHSSAIRHLSLSPDGNTVASLSNDGKARLWDLSTKKDTRSGLSPSEIGWMLIRRPWGKEECLRYLTAGVCEQDAELQSRIIEARLAAMTDTERAHQLLSDVAAAEPTDAAVSGFASAKGRQRWLSAVLQEQGLNLWYAGRKEEAKDAFVKAGALPTFDKLSGQANKEVEQALSAFRILKPGERHHPGPHVSGKSAPPIPNGDANMKFY